MPGEQSPNSHARTFPPRGKQVTGRTEPELWSCRPGLESLLVAVRLSVFRQTVEFLRASVSAQDDFCLVGAGEGLQVAGTSCMFYTQGL